MRRLALLMLIPAFGLAACASTPIDPAVVQSAAYQTGYSDGCATGAARARIYDRSLKRDETAYAQDDKYHRGWNVGFRECGSNATQRDPDSEPVADWRRTGPLN